MEETKKFYWMSFTLIHTSGALGFGNTYMCLKDKLVHFPTLQNSLAQEYKAKRVIVLFWKEVTEAEYDSVLARDVSLLKDNISNKK